MEKVKLTENARSKLRELTTSAEWNEIRWFLKRLGPLAMIDTTSSTPMEIAALTGAQSRGWEKCLRAVEDISDPNYKANTIG